MQLYNEIDKVFVSPLGLQDRLGSAKPVTRLEVIYCCQFTCMTKSHVQKGIGIGHMETVEMCRILRVNIYACRHKAQKAKPVGTQSHPNMYISQMWWSLSCL